MADMSWTGHWSSVVVIDKFIHPCNYSLSIDFNAGETDAVRQHTAFSRIKYLVEEIMHDSVLIAIHNPLLAIFKNDTFGKTITFAVDPLEVIIAATIWRKINAITENEIELERISVSSDQSENLVSHIDQDFMDSVDNDLTTDPFIIHKHKVWWNRSDAGATDWMEVTGTDEDGKKHIAIKLDTTEWPEFLDWDFDDKVFDKTNKDNVISIKSTKWKPEVIPGDKA